MAKFRILRELTIVDLKKKKPDYVDKEGQAYEYLPDEEVLERLRSK